MCRIIHRIASRFLPHRRCRRRRSSSATSTRRFRRLRRVMHRIASRFLCRHRRRRRRRFPSATSRRRLRRLRRVVRRMASHRIYLAVIAAAVASLRQRQAVVAFAACPVQNKRQTATNTQLGAFVVDAPGLAVPCVSDDLGLAA